jgi:hypothetical protein
LHLGSGGQQLAHLVAAGTLLLRDPHAVLTALQDAGKAVAHRDGPHRRRLVAAQQLVQRARGRRGRPAGHGPAEHRLVVPRLVFAQALLGGGERARGAPGGQRRGDGPIVGLARGCGQRQGGGEHPEEEAGGDDA